MDENLNRRFAATDAPGKYERRMREIAAGLPASDRMNLMVAQAVMRDQIERERQLDTWAKSRNAEWGAMTFDQWRHIDHLEAHLENLIGDMYTAGMVVTTVEAITSNAAA